jgi:hypothetical protein
MFWPATLAKTRTPMIGKCLDVLAFITRLARTFMARAKAAAQQREADKLAENPSGWFRGHFSHQLHTHDDGQAAKTDTDHPGT